MDAGLHLPRLLAVARGDEPADVVLRNTQLVNVASGEVHAADIALAGAHIAAVGAGYHARVEHDLGGAYVAPGFIDAHVHIESAMVPPSEFARVVVPRGVTAVISDPHEIANVVGADGVRFMLKDARQSALSVYFNAPSCVPATQLATAGARLDSTDLKALRAEPEVLGLAEVMNYPGVIQGDSEVLAKLSLFRGCPIDGHCPGLSRAELNAYVAAGVGSDHESTSVEEARHKLRLGLRVFLREATSARNLRALLALVGPASERRLCFCTDDRHVPDLIDEGSVDHLVRVAIDGGVDPVSAIRMATLNVAEHFGLADRGMVAPGRRADLVVFAELRAPRPEAVYVAGQVVAREGRLLTPRCPAPVAFTDSVRIDWDGISFGVPDGGPRIRVIGVVPEQVVTEHRILPARIEGGCAVADPTRDLLKMAVIERHLGSGRVGLGFVQGVGLRRGAIAGTVAHDHHNLAAIGADDRSLTTAARAVAEVGGGLAVADGERVLARLALPIAGLMSDRPYEEVDSALRALSAAAAQLGADGRDPFMLMSFLALEVIPALKLTDQGLVDVSRFRRVPLFAQ
ncbi:MAG: adenine deaminase [Myxococcales bacterium]|nr:adenine deaminase [Myxococcales bacterium]